MGPEKAEPTRDHGGSRKRFSPPPKRSSAPSPGPRLAIAIQAAPPSRGEAGKVSTQSGETGEQRPGTSRLPKASRPFPAASAGRRPPLGSRPRAPHAPCARDRGRGGQPPREGGRGPATGSRAAVATPRGLKLATARPSRPRLGDAPGEGGATGPGCSAAPASPRQGRRERIGVLPSTARASAPAGPLGPGGGGGARFRGGGGGGPGSVARRRGWAPGGGESEARPAS